MQAAACNHPTLKCEFRSFYFTWSKNYVEVICWAVSNVGGGGWEDKPKKVS